MLYKEKWYELEAFILDKKYLNKLQEKFNQCEGEFFGYGVAVKDFNSLMKGTQNYARNEENGKKEN